ncbi:hypothetical protein BpHYR1_013602 [Brachionus plicatilis]|uniref:Uncharacterized protein n=1 Tax=Brachionus plicatilis TaxID=10195 RepID=A0A3M7T4B7_BRAPC|nr:hypothetical protein BpHYR1_013602 [Brachionus plicatilis]
MVYCKFLLNDFNFNKDFNVNIFFNFIEHNYLTTHYYQIYVVFAYRIPLFSDACFNTMSRIFGAWSNIDLTILMGHIVDTY